MPGGLGTVVWVL